MLAAAGNQILITKTYDDMFHRILHRRKNDTSYTARGVVITGKPGIGPASLQISAHMHATTQGLVHMIYRTNYLLKFMFVRLISVRQVILLCDNSHSYLFYRGTMYFQPPDTALRDFPADGEHGTPPYGH